jgi:hypothetical protein
LAAPFTSPDEEFVKAVIGGAVLAIKKVVQKFFNELPTPG